MDPAAITDIIVKLGIGALSIFGMIYVIAKAQKERETNQKSFMSYIETNNHQTTALVERATTSIIESTETIKAHTESIKINNEITSKLLSKFLERQ